LSAGPCWILQHPRNVATQPKAKTMPPKDASEQCAQVGALSDAGAQLATRQIDLRTGSFVAKRIS